MALQLPNKGAPPTGIGGDTFDTAALKLFDNTTELYTFLGYAPETGLLPNFIPIAKGGTGGNTPQQARDSLSLYSKDETDSKLAQVVQSTADSIAAVNDKVKPITEGGTGANNAFNARSNLDVYSKSEVESLVGNIVSIGGGGTGADNAEDARANLDVYSQAEVDLAIDEAVSAATPFATESVAGIAKIATTEISQAGTNDTDFITAKKLRDALNATGGAPTYALRAWGIIGGTLTPASLIKGGNVASIIDKGVGKYQVVFTTPLESANYAVLFGNIIYASNNIAPHGAIQTSTKTTTGFEIACGSSSYLDVIELYFGVIE